MTEQEAFVGLNLIPSIGSVKLGRMLEVFGCQQEKQLYEYIRREPSMI
jgi:hypothetical protein